MQGRFEPLDAPFGALYSGARRREANGSVMLADVVHELQWRREAAVDRGVAGGAKVARSAVSVARGAGPGGGVAADALAGAAVAFAGAGAGAETDARTNRQVRQTRYPTPLLLHFHDLQQSRLPCLPDLC